MEERGKFWQLFFEDERIYERKQVVDIRFEYIKKFVKGRKILDFGFGTGYFIKNFHLNGLDVYGSDIPRKGKEKIREKFSKLGIKVFFSDIRKLPFDDDYFDTIVASEVMEHLTERELNVAMKEIFRVLKKKGRFIITVPYKEKLKENMVICPFCLKKFHPHLHKQTFDENKIRKIAAKIDFGKIRFLTFLTFLDFFRRIPFELRYLTSQLALKLQITAPYYLLAILEK
jgi:SAM-dependent methyltransferase